MASGGIQQNFDETEGLTRHEDRTLRWVVKDEDDADVTDFSGWAVTLYVLASGGRLTADGPTELSATARVEKAATLSAPNADVALGTAEWGAGALDDPGAYDYELWRTDTGNVRRLAYGFIRVIT